MNSGPFMYVRSGSPQSRTFLPAGVRSANVEVAPDPVARGWACPKRGFGRALAFFGALTLRPNPFPNPFPPFPPRERAVEEANSPPVANDGTGFMTLPNNDPEGAGFMVLPNNPPDGAGALPKSPPEGRAWPKALAPVMKNGIYLTKY